MPPRLDLTDAERAERRRRQTVEAQRRFLERNPSYFRDWHAAHLERAREIKREASRRFRAKKKAQLDAQAADKRGR